MPVTNYQWILYDRFRMGITAVSGGRSCPGCSRPMDCFGDHALSCKSLGVYGRHNCVRNAFAQLALDAGLNVQLEVAAPDNGLRPADVLVTGLEFAPCALDVAVDHELQPSLSFATMTTETAVQGE